MEPQFPHWSNRDYAFCLTQKGIKSGEVMGGVKGYAQGFPGLGVRKTPSVQAQTLPLCDDHTEL